MQYPYLTFLESTTILLALFIGATIFYFLIKWWQKITFLTALKTIGLYELVSILLYLIYPFPLLSRISNNSIFTILDVLIYSIISFLIFGLLMKKLLSLDWKKSLIVFLSVILIAFPLLDFLRTKLAQEIINLPAFTTEISEFKNQIESQGFYSIISGQFNHSLPLKIIGTIEEAMLSWPSIYLNNILIRVSPISKNETANWQIYRNTKYGYEFKHPQNIEIVEAGMVSPPANEKSTDIVLVDKNTGEDISAVMLPSLTEEEGNLSLDDLVNKVAKGFDKKEDLIIDGNNAIKLTFGEYMGGDNQGIDISSLSFVANNIIVIFVKHNQMFIMFEFDRNNEILFNQILSTFKFIR